MEFSSGEFIALSPKCYFAKSDDGVVKMGTKGLPHRVAVTLENFRQRLYDGTPFYVELQTLTRRNNVMSRVKTTKNSLCRTFVKFPVHSDAITCTPLQKGNIYL